MRRQQSFLIGSGGLSDDGNGSHREARFNYLPKGYCLGNARDTVSVSKYLGGKGGVHYTTADYIRSWFESHNERRHWSMLLELYGLPKCVPLDQDFKCPGLKAFGQEGSDGYLPAKPCTKWPEDQRDELPPIYCSFAEEPHHPFHKTYLCVYCNLEARTRGVQILERKKDTGEDLTTGEADLLSNQKFVTETVRLAIRDISFAKRRLTDSAFEEDHSKRRKKQYAEHLASGKPQKKTGPQRKSTKNAIFPERVNVLLSTAYGILAKTGGRPSYATECLNALYDRIVLSEALRRPDGHFAIVNDDDDRDDLTARSRVFNITSLVDGFPWICLKARDAMIKKHMNPPAKGKRSWAAIDPPSDAELRETTKKKADTCKDDHEYFDWIVGETYKSTFNEQWKKVTSQDLINMGADNNVST